MKDIALHILDITQNSITAGADLIEIIINEDAPDGMISIYIKDNGAGVPKEMLKQITDPYTTSRKTRKVGMGLPLLRQNAEQTGGSLTINSELGKGTEVNVKFAATHIDLPPWGDISGVIILMVAANPEIIFSYIHRSVKGEYEFDTREVKKALEGVPIDNAEIREFLKDMINENLNEIGACNTKLWEKDNNQ